jgi:hypothetical protein
MDYTALHNYLCENIKPYMKIVDHFFLEELVNCYVGQPVTLQMLFPVVLNKRDHLGSRI